MAMERGRIIINPILSACMLTVRPELFEENIRLLEAMKAGGMSEVLM